MTDLTTETTMRAVMKTIFEAKRTYATLPLFDFMRDESQTWRAGSKHRRASRCDTWGTFISIWRPVTP